MKEESAGLRVKRQAVELEKVYDAWSDCLITSEDYFTECFRICSENVESFEKVW